MRISLVCARSCAPRCVLLGGLGRWCEFCGRDALVCVTVENARDGVAVKSEALCYLPYLVPLSSMFADSQDLFVWKALTHRSTPLSWLCVSTPFLHLPDNPPVAQVHTLEPLVFSTCTEDATILHTHRHEPIAEMCCVGAESPSRVDIYRGKTRLAPT